MKIPVAIEPSEIWTLDYCAAVGKRRVDLWRQVLDGARSELATAPKPDAEGKVKTAEEALAKAEKELAEYTPGTGPTFTIGHLLGKLPAIVGMVMDADKEPGAERFTKRLAWAREAIRWGVRGHANLKNARGDEVPFEGEQTTLHGMTFTRPTERQIDRYGLLEYELAQLVLQTQGPDSHA